MWGLDRFSAHSTPGQSPTPRNFSPAPRRTTSHLAPNNRSTQSLVSPSCSTSNLANTSRPTSGSGLRNQIYNAPPEDAEDPVKALERIIASPTAQPKKEQVNGETEQQQQRPLELLQDIDFKGLSLYDFANQLESPHAVTYTKQTIDEYEKEKEKFEDLHKSINACDDVLVSVETYLSGFQSDLGAVSAEIETLQARSTEINGQLEKRREVEKLLGPVVDQLTIPPPVVKKICDDPIDASWVQALEELKTRSKALESSTVETTNAKAAEDLQPMIESLSNRAVERTRDYLAAQIKAIRSPNMNAQIIQQQSFLANRAAFAFLASRQPQLAEDIVRAYVNTMRWYYVSHFTRYQASLTKLKLFSVDRSNLLGEESSNSSSRRPAMTSQTPFIGTIPTSDPFNISRRIDILKHPAATALPSHAAEDSTTPHQIETPFLSFNLALLDNASFEYTFLSNFLPPDLCTTQKLTSYFNDIFSPSLQLGSTLTKSLTAESYDALGVLLLIRITQHFAFTLQRRKVPALESYVNGTNMTLWPRFQSIMDAHCESLKKLTASLPATRSAAAASASAVSSLTSSSTSNLASTSAPSSASSTAPRPISQRTAHFINSILLLVSEGGDNEPVSNSLNRLRGEFENVLAKMGQAFGAGEKGRRERERFLRNNVSLVLAVVDAEDKGDGTKGRLRSEVREALEALVQA